MAKVIISTGHYGKSVCLPGAVGNGYKEAVEARKIVERVGQLIGKNEAITFTDTTSKTQIQNLKTITNYHNSKRRELDVSIHFNAGGGTGVEVLYKTQKAIATNWAGEIAKTLNLKNRGAKHRPELAFLRNTKQPAVLIEICFIDSKDDMKAYKANFEKLCLCIAELIADQVQIELPKVTVIKTPTPIAELYYTVKSNDTLYSIAKNHQTTIASLKSLNKLDSNIIKIGQKLRVK